VASDFEITKIKTYEKIIRRYGHVDDCVVRVWTDIGPAE
jgi:hypothetical protein